MELTKIEKNKTKISSFTNIPLETIVFIGKIKLNNRKKLRE